MQIHKGNDPQTLADIRAAGEKIEELVERLAIEHWTKHGNKQRAISILVSALQHATIACIVNMAHVYGQDFPKEDRVLLAKVLQEAANAAIMKVINRIPQQGN
jgi:peptide subunit release factor RF-3